MSIKISTAFVAIGYMNRKTQSKGEEKSFWHQDKCGLLFASLKQFLSTFYIYQSCLQNTFLRVHLAAIHAAFRQLIESRPV